MTRIRDKRSLANSLCGVPPSGLHMQNDLSPMRRRRRRKKQTIFFEQTIFRKQTIFFEQTISRKQTIFRKQTIIGAKAGLEDMFPLLLLLLFREKAAHTVEVPGGLVRCCDQSPNSRCRWYCRGLLKEPPPSEAHDQVLNKLVAAGCGAPLPSERLWQCFLRASHIPGVKILQPPSKSNLQGTKPGHTAALLPLEPSDATMRALPLDLARAHCCHRARTLECHQLCLKTFGREWTSSWMDFDRHCQYNPQEHQLLQCIEQAGDPCELGCNGLRFCKAFNGRPLEFFSNCKANSDVAARHDASLDLMTGPSGSSKEGFTLPDPIGRFLTPNVSLHCPQRLWTAVTCILQIKPCHIINHDNRICRTDCAFLVSSCTDGENDQDLCKVLSPPEGEPCVPLNWFLAHGEKEEDDEDPGMEDLHQPCRAQPCPNGDLCLVHGKGYKCITGCRLGEMSRNLVPSGTWLLVPVTSTTVGCQRPCRCGQRHLTASLCTEVEIPCRVMDTCILTVTDRNTTQVYAHNRFFSLPCKSCYCFDGQITCWNRICETSSIEDADSTPVLSETPCSCPSHYVPVCGKNGKTYPSACYARCARLEKDQFESGSCHSNNPCISGLCSSSQRCISRRRTCLVWKSTGCPQYECVETKNCSDMFDWPVCDTNGNEHRNLCWLLKSNGTLDYLGGCRNDLKSDGVVCGMDGEEYDSEAQAWAQYTLKDYEGPCRTYPHVNSSCSRVGCQPISKYCKKIFMPGACCALCGGGFLSLAYSPRMLSHYLEDYKTDDPDGATVWTLAHQLAQRLTISECRLSAHSSARRSRLLVAVTVTTMTPSMLQSRACALEALKLGTLLEQRNPASLLQLPLASVVGIDFGMDVGEGTDPSRACSLLVLCCLFIIGW